MYIGVLHPHVLIVSLYLLQLFIKLVLIAAKKEEALEKFSKKTKIVHIVLASLMVITGVILLVVPKAEGIPAAITQPYMWVKLVLVLASIPVGIIGVKKRSLALTAVSFLLMAGVFVLAYMFNPQAKTSQEDINKELQQLEQENQNAEVKLNAAELSGKAIYNTNCVQCHGLDGKMGALGANDLTLTQLSDEEQANIIRNGKGQMSGYPAFSEEDITNVLAYIKTLK